MLVVCNQRNITEPKTVLVLEPKTVLFFLGGGLLWCFACSEFVVVGSTANLPTFLFTNWSVMVGWLLRFSLRPCRFGIPDRVAQCWERGRDRGIITRCLTAMRIGWLHLVKVRVRPPHLQQDSSTTQIPYARDTT